MSVDALKLLRLTITIQVLVATWFIFSPDLLPDLIRAAEMRNDRALYAKLDNIIVPLMHFQTLLCIALWRPTRLASWGYVTIAIIVAVLGLFAGPALLSAIDSVFGYLQILASGGMLCILYTHRYLSLGLSLRIQPVDTDAPSNNDAQVNKHTRPTKIAARFLKSKFLHLFIVLILGLALGLYIGLCNSKAALERNYKTYEAVETFNTFARYEAARDISVALKEKDYGRAKCLANLEASSGFDFVKRCMNTKPCVSYIEKEVKERAPEILSNTHSSFDYLHQKYGIRRCDAANSTP